MELEAKKEKIGCPNEKMKNHASCEESWKIEFGRRKSNVQGDGGEERMGNGDSEKNRMGMVPRDV